MLYTGNHYVYSPYKVKAQTTKVQLPSSVLESYSKTLKPVAHSDATVTYGPYANVEPFSSEEVCNGNYFIALCAIQNIFMKLFLIIYDKFG